MAVWTTTDVGVYRASERAYAMMPKLWMRRGERPPVIYCHGYGEGALEPLTPDHPGQYQMLRALAEAGWPVLACDLGGVSTWGNDTGQTAIGQAISYAQSTLGARGGQVVMMGTSMGGGLALAYTAEHPAAVACTVAIGPATDLVAMRTVGYSAAIDAAYGGTYSDTTHGPTHNPQKQATAGKYAGRPIRIWHGDTDTVTTPAMITTFATTVGGTDLIRTTVPGGHAESTWAAVPTTDLVAYVRQHAS